MDSPSQDPMNAWADSILCPTCPKCGRLPVLELLGLYQWFCPNEDCNVFCWVPYVTAEENLSDVGRLVELGDE